MMQTFENAEKYGKQFLDSGFESLAAVTREAQAIFGEASNYVKKVLTSTEAVEKRWSAKSIRSGGLRQAEL